MNRTAQYRRGEILREVIETMNVVQDATLPFDLARVPETFGDELDLLGALTLRWHTLLASTIERSLTSEPEDLEAAVLAAWRETRDELPGVRVALDRYAAAPTSPEMARALDVASSKTWALMALMAGQASGLDAAAAEVGRAVEARARITPEEVVRPQAVESPSLRARLRLRRAMAA